MADELTPADFPQGELQEESVVNQWLTTAADGKNYSVAYYNLDAIISVGYRINSIRGTQFRIWATQQLSELMRKGFVLNKYSPKDSLRLVRSQSHYRDIKTVGCSDLNGCQLYDRLLPLFRHHSSGGCLRTPSAESKQSFPLQDVAIYSYGKTVELTGGKNMYMNGITWIELILLIAQIVIFVVKL